MLPGFLLPTTTIETKGSGEPVDIAHAAGSTLLLTLGVTEVVEQESLDVTISGSADGEEWAEVRVFPQKFYDGTYQILCNLSETPDIKQLRVDWQCARWGVAQLVFPPCDRPAGHHCNRGGS